MKTAEAARAIDGKKLYQARAREALPTIVRQAKANQPIEYGALAEKLGMPSPR